MKRSTVQDSGAAPSGELVALLRRAMQELDEKYRLPIALHYEEQLSRSQVAAVLDIPERTVSHYLSVGLEKIRHLLAKSGYTGAPAVIVGALAHTAPPVPATLMAMIEKAVSGLEVAGAGSGTAAASAASKGGLAMKAIVGLVAAGALAGATAAGLSVLGPRPSGAASAASGLPAVKPATGMAAPGAAGPAGTAKFDIPVWHADARWKLDPEAFIAGTDKSGNLDGPRCEMVWRRGFATWGDYEFFEQRGLPVNFCMLDKASDSVHVVAGSARGYLDGPFSRARWGGQAYMHPSSRAMSADRRYLISADAGNRGAIRVLDLKEQMVSTLLPPESQAQAIAIDSKGQAVVFCKGGLLLTMDIATRQKVSELKLKATEGLDLAPGYGLALDEVHGKLYASGHPLPNGNWHVWYFDLNDGGSFHGVLAAKGKKNASYAGPFDGYESYGEGSIRFGPDDPEKRFLYMAVTDTANPMRLDLERRVAAMFTETETGKGGDRLARFIEEGKGKYVTEHSGVGWMPDGSIVVPGSLYESARVYRRVK